MQNCTGEVLANNSSAWQQMKLEQHIWHWTLAENSTCNELWVLSFSIKAASACLVVTTCENWMASGRCPKWENRKLSKNQTLRIQEKWTLVASCGESAESACQLFFSLTFICGLVCLATTQMCWWPEQGKVSTNHLGYVSLKWIFMRTWVERTIL